MIEAVIIFGMIAAFVAGWVSNNLYREWMVS